MTGSTSPVSPCRFCTTPLRHSFADLGLSPLCQSLVKLEKREHAESFYPLHAYVCENCLLVQLAEYVSPADIFTEYAYFSSFSDSWVDHARRYAEAMVERLKLDADSKVVEIASNDGYLLQHFRNRGIPVLGIEPAANVAAAAIGKGIPTLVRFFGSQTAREASEIEGKADLLLGNNVLAHVPDLMDFVTGMKIMLAPSGVITMEFPHLLRLIQDNQFDTIYHEHFSYFSFSTVERIFDSRGITLFDVEELPTHGGSLRIYGRHAEDAAKPVTENVQRLRNAEKEAGLHGLDIYLRFGEKVRETKRKILELLISAKREGKTVAAYAAAGKTNTLLNYCGIGVDFIDYSVDKNPYKQNNLLPGSRIPIFPPEKLKQTKPDFLFIGAWNLKDEIMAQTDFIREWGGKWMVPIPEAKVFA